MGKVCYTMRERICFSWLYIRLGKETITGRNYGYYTKDAKGRKGIQGSKGSKKTADKEAFAGGTESEYDEPDPQSSRHDRPSGH